ncbi:uncharacterized protein PHALS_07432 [Plasmopara halstedii]|uniref:Uncharacterized protein n=1 Tax=Plasmopara halstedii TaxID=4781 RepID=A0A0P1B4G8_PLAHL|nr:uncharacterized protein PHALS_07432 [Plasmopara halstedii]CEG49680.1 hypothetical protein PHALS_07432 [Plasmopara halstedii]|eukprot:XP_024586049.1 hypothetical protein PHALS_07432 [Plasmopara halstedii]
MVGYTSVVILRNQSRREQVGAHKAISAYGILTHNKLRHHKSLNNDCLCRESSLEIAETFALANEQIDLAEFL